METDAAKRRRHGPAPLDPAEKREHTVSVRLNAAELAQLDRLRAPVAMQRGEYLRAAALHRLPPVIPALNRHAWAELARAAANLNQLTHRINRVDRGEPEAVPSTVEIARLLAELRRRLIGADLVDDPGP